MSDDDASKSYDLKIDGLGKLLHALKNPPSIRIGILGGSGARKKSEKTNAEIGVIHEYGVGNMSRSFLRVPLIDHLDKRLASAGLLDKETLQKVLEEGTLIPYCKKVAIVAEGIVAEAFETGGFGKWAPSNMSGKKVHQTLVETQQLRNSITSEVKEKQ